MDSRFKPMAYRVQAVPSSSGGLSTACVMSCMVTGKMLSGSGGGGHFISPAVFELLERDEEVQALIQKKLDALPVA